MPLGACGLWPQLINFPAHKCSPPRKKSCMKPCCSSDPIIPHVSYSECSSVVLILSSGLCCRLIRPLPDTLHTPSHIHPTLPHTYTPHSLIHTHHTPSHIHPTIPHTYTPHILTHTPHSLTHTPALPHHATHTPSHRAQTHSVLYYPQVSCVCPYLSS